MNLYKQKTQKLNGKIPSGFTLVEMLVVVFIFSLIGILLTQSLTLSLRSSNKSESLVRVKQSVEYSLSFMERSLRNAREIRSCTGNRLEFLTNDGEKYFYCDATGGYIITDYATTTTDNRISSPDVSIINCNLMFSCVTTSVPHSVNIEIEAQDKNVSGVEAGKVSSKTKILLRNY